MSYTRCQIFLPRLTGLCGPHIGTKIYIFSSKKKRPSMESLAMRLPI